MAKHALPAWEAILPFLPDEFSSAQDAGALSARERQVAESYQRAAEELMTVLADGQTALNIIFREIDDLDVPERHKHALLILCSSLGSLAGQLALVERYSGEYLQMAEAAEGAL